MANIKIYVPDQDTLEIDLDGYEQVSVGRSPDNDVVIDHVSMSGSHAVIQNLGGVFQLNDQGSTNGTFVNQQPVAEVVLSNGDSVMFGSVEATFTDEAAEDASTEEAASEETVASSEGGGYGAHHAEIGEVSNRPNGFKNLSPIEKVEKKDVIGQIAVLVGVVAILAAIAVAGLAFTMTGG